MQKLVLRGQLCGSPLRGWLRGWLRGSPLRGRLRGQQRGQLRGRLRGPPLPQEWLAREWGWGWYWNYAGVKLAQGRRKLEGG